VDPAEEASTGRILVILEAGRKYESQAAYLQYFDNQVKADGMGDIHNTDWEDEKFLQYFSRIKWRRELIFSSRRKLG
jgi:hypothetical protein